MNRFETGIAAGWLVALVSLQACSTVPGTGRSQLDFVPLSYEMSLGASAWGEALSEAKVVTSGPDAEMVQRVGSRVSQAAIELFPDPAAKFDWEFVLVDEPKTVNAWALPGGKSAVYTGLLPVTQDENSLAAVVGHEVAHAIAHHGSERMSQGLVFELGLLVASTSASDMDAADKDLMMQALVGVGTYGVMLPFSRSHESEADHLGLLIAAEAGYDPRAAVGLWQRMQQSSSGSTPEFLSTHPSEETRIARLQELMPQAIDLYNKSKQRTGPKIEP